MPDERQMEKRQQVLAEFGEFALRSDNLDAVPTLACRLVADALGTGRAQVLEIEHQDRPPLVAFSKSTPPSETPVTMKHNARSSVLNIDRRPAPEFGDSLLRPMTKLYDEYFEHLGTVTSTGLHVPFHEKLPLLHLRRVALAPLAVWITRQHSRMGESVDGPV